MQYNIVQRPKKTLGTFSEAYFIKVNSSHFRIKQQKHKLYKWSKIKLNGYNHNSKSRNKLFELFRKVYSIETNRSCLKVFTVSTVNL